MNYVKKPRLELLGWSSQSPELNIIAHLWVNFIYALLARQPKTIAKSEKFGGFNYFFSLQKSTKYVICCRKCFLLRFSAWTTNNCLYLVVLTPVTSGKESSSSLFSLSSKNVIPVQFMATMNLLFGSGGPREEASPIHRTQSMPMSIQSF